MIRMLGMSLIAIVVLGLVACSSTEPDMLVTPFDEEPVFATTEPAVIKPAEPTLEVSGQQEAGELPGTWEEMAAGVTELPNFRREMILRFDAFANAPGVGSWQMESDYAVSENLSARVLEINYDGGAVAVEFQSMTAGQKDGYFFLDVPTIGCISTSEQDFERMSSGIVDPGNYLGGMVDAPLIATGEVVNDQLAHHFGLDNQSLPRFADQDVSVNGHFYVSEEDGHPLRLLLEVSGVADFAETGQVQDGTLYVEVNWYETGDSPEVIIPQNCLQSDIYPLPEGSYNITSLGDLVGFHTLLSINDVVAFYQGEMAASGWAAVEEPTVLDDSAFITFSRNGLELIVNIEAGPALGEVSVVISP
jgi:hypothetical protein